MRYARFGKLLAVLATAVALGSLAACGAMPTPTPVGRPLGGITVPTTATPTPMAAPPTATLIPPTATSTPVPPTRFPRLASLPENPCDVLTVEQVSAATGLQVTAQQRLPSHDEEAQARRENRAPRPGQFCRYETTSEFGTIDLTQPLPAEQTAAAYWERRNAYFRAFPGSAQAVPGLGEDAWLGGGTSLHVLVRDGVWFELMTQYYQRSSRDLLVRLASAAIGVPVTGTPMAGLVTPTPTAAPPRPPTATAGPRAGLPSNLPLLVDSGDQELLVRVDPVSLQDVEGFPRFDLGPGYKVYAMSPDRRVLAAMVYRSYQPGEGGELRLFDLAAWAETTTTITVDTGIHGGLVFSPDGQALYWAKPSYIDASHGEPREYRLYRYEIGRDKLEEVLQFPLSFRPWGMRSLRSGRLAVFVVPNDGTSLSGEAPRVLLVAPEERRVVADVPLEGLKAWRYQEPNSEEFPSWIYRPGLAWDTAGDRLYIAHADSDKVTAVDLAQGRVLAQGVRRPLSLWDRVLALFATAAEAKMVNTAERKAALSPDGATLYVTGTQSEWVKQADGQSYDCVVYHSGLRAVSTGDLREIGKLDISGGSMALSPDGKTLLLGGSTGQQAGCAYIGGLYVVDAKSLEERAHLEPQALVWPSGFSHDGRYVYVSLWRLDPSAPRGIIVRVLDLNSLQFVAELSGVNVSIIEAAIGP